MFQVVQQDWRWVVATAGIIGGALLLGYILYHLIFRIAKRLIPRTQNLLQTSLTKHCRGPFQIIFPFLIADLFLPLLDVAPKTREIFDRAFGWFMTIAVAWLIIRLTNVLEDILLSRFTREGESFKTKGINTQIQILRKIVAVIVGIIALGIILMSFEKVRQLGTSILASAGIAGIVVGLAAQRSIGSLIAGIQIAFTEPIRLEDVVVAEGEWGWIEEINLTYVVLRTWDLRRMILPITYFLEKPFQNWTRQAPDLLGTVFLYVDYNVPVHAVREELRHILENSKLWDGKAWGLQVTNASEHAVELRALVSAADSSKAWDLRCEVREKLLEFIQKNYPQGLPRIRAEVSETGHKTKEETSARGSS